MMLDPTCCLVLKPNVGFPQQEVDVRLRHAESNQSR